MEWIEIGADTQSRGSRLHCEKKNGKTPIGGRWRCRHRRRPHHARRQQRLLKVNKHTSDTRGLCKDPKQDHNEEKCKHKQHISFIDDEQNAKQTLYVCYMEFPGLINKQRYLQYKKKPYAL